MPSIANQNSIPWGVGAVGLGILGALRVTLFLIAALVLSGAGSGHATEPGAPGAIPQAASSGPSALLTAEAARELVSRMSDEELRAMLAPGAAAQPGRSERAADIGLEAARMMGGVEDRFARLRAGLADLPEAVARVHEIPVALDRLMTQGRTVWQPLVALAAFAVLLLAGWGAENVVRRMSGGSRRRLFATLPNGPRRRLTVFGKSAAIEFLALTAFAVTGIALFFALWQGHVPTRQLVLGAFAVFVCVRVAVIVSRLALCPDRPALRIVHLEDGIATALHRRVIACGALAGSAVFLTGAMRLAGLDGALVRLVASVALILVGALVIGAIRRIAKGAAVPEGADALTRTLGRWWSVPATAYVVAMIAAGILLSSLGVPGAIVAAFWSIMLLAALPVVEASAALLVRGLGARDEAEPGDADGEKRTVRGILVRMVRALVLLAALFVFAGLWGIDPFTVARDRFGGGVVRVVLDIGITAVLAYLVWSLIAAAIDRRLEREGGVTASAQPSGGEPGGKGLSRLATLLPLVRKVLFMTVLTISAMIVLASLGVDIGPLLAGAGVVGLAVGFGAQTLVRDIVSGIFFLLDDAFRIGEYVEIDAIRGTVEHISVRSLRLRHHRGPLHTVPFGEIRYLTNYSRDWAITKLEFRLPFDTDLQLVKRIVKQVGKDMLAHPEHGTQFLEPLKSQGVRRMEETAMIVGVKFMTKPGAQFLIRREIYQRLRDVFDANGIQFARPQVTVVAPPGSDRDDPRIGDAAAAAALHATASSAKVPS